MKSLENVHATIATIAKQVANLRGLSDARNDTTEALIKSLAERGGSITPDLYSMPSEYCLRWTGMDREGLNFLDLFRTEYRLDDLWKEPWFDANLFEEIDEREGVRPDLVTRKRRKLSRQCNAGRQSVSFTEAMISISSHLVKALPDCHSHPCPPILVLYSGHSKRSLNLPGRPTA